MTASSVLGRTRGDLVAPSPAPPAQSRGAGIRVALARPLASAMPLVGAQR